MKNVMKNIFRTLIGSVILLILILIILNFPIPTLIFFILVGGYIMGSILF